jgi:hypothetical protein
MRSRYIHTAVLLVLLLVLAPEAPGASAAQGPGAVLSGQVALTAGAHIDAGVGPQAGGPLPVDSVGQHCATAQPCRCPDPCPVCTADEVCVQYGWPPNRCWVGCHPAAGASIMKYWNDRGYGGLGSNADAIMVELHRYMHTDECGATRRGNSAQGIESYAASKGYHFDATCISTHSDCNGQQPTFQQFVNEIDAGRPPIVAYKGHAYTGIGYKTSGQIAILNKNQRGDPREVGWSEITSGTGVDAAGLIAIRPVDTQPPRLDFRVLLYHPSRTNHSAPILVRIRERGGHRLFYEGLATTNGDGWHAGLELPGVTTGSYDVVIKAPASISKRASDVHFTAGRHTSVDFTDNGAAYLRGGDFNDDDMINMLDVSRVITNWKTDDPLIDLTGDGIVNMYELAIVLGGWKRRGDDFANVQEQSGHAATVQVGAGPASLQLSPGSGTYSVGQEFDVHVNIATGGATIDGTDVVLRYDPCALQVQSISEGPAFSEYPELSGYPEEGEIGISAKDTFNGSGTVATVRFRVIAGNTVSGLRVYFRLAATTDSNIAQSGSSAEILGSVGHARYTLTGTPSRPPLSGTFAPSSGSYLALFDVPITLDLDDPCGVVAEEVGFDVYYDSAWHSIGLDRNKYNGWSTSWNTVDAPDQIVSLRAVVSDTNGVATTLTAQNLTLDRCAPVPAIAVPGFPPANGTFVVNWSGSDNLSGLASYDVQYRDGPDGCWVDWQSQTTETYAVFVGQEGHNYYFRVRARDRAGNLSAFSEERVVLGDPSHAYLPLVSRAGPGDGQTNHTGCR